MKTAEKRELDHPRFLTQRKHLFITLPLLCALCIFLIALDHLGQPIQVSGVAFFDFCKAALYALIIINAWRLAKKEKMWGWYAIAYGAAAWLPGQILMGIYAITQNDAHVSLLKTQAFAFLALPGAVIGALLVGLYGLTKRERTQIIVNSLCFGSCVAFLSIVFIVGVILPAHNLQVEDQYGNLFSFAFDLIFISLNLAICLYRRFDKVFVPYALGMVFQAMADVGFYLAQFQNNAHYEAVNRFFLFASIIAWSYATLTPSGKPIKKGTVHGEKMLTIGVFGTIFATIVFAFARISSTKNISPAVLYSFVAMFVAVLVAQFVSYFDNKKLQAEQDEAIVKISQSEERYQDLATHDSLTGLVNRSFFIAELKHTLDECKKNGEDLALLFIDLDRFKEINDTHGHSVGDEVIITIANRICDVVGDAGLVSRLGGDEFSVLVRPPAQRDETFDIATRILEAAIDPLDLAGIEAYLSCSIGIAFSTATDHNAQSLLRNADAAMYRAKELGRNRIEYADDVVKPVVHQSGWTLSELHHAIQNDEIAVYYQPIYELKTDTIVACEALARWIHPRSGIISPAEFIPVAEDNGLIIDIGNAIIRKSLDQLHIWHQQAQGSGSIPLSMNFNLSFRQLNDQHLLETMLTTCSDLAIDPSYVNIEMTESALLGDVRNAIATLNEIQSHGFRLHIDDFGTGYSSLSYLKKFPISGFKIDKAYVQGFGRDEDDTAIVTALVALGKSMELSVTAEGIQSKVTRDALLNLGCEFGQGYFYSEPLPADQVNLQDLSQQQAGRTLRSIS
jgi:diguanylate cyclase (GGDEF)-like protein